MTHNVICLNAFSCDKFFYSRTKQYTAKWPKILLLITSRTIKQKKCMLFNKPTGYFSIKTNKNDSKHLLLTLNLSRGGRHNRNESHRLSAHLAIFI